MTHGGGNQVIPEFLAASCAPARICSFISRVLPRDRGRETIDECGVAWPPAPSRAPALFEIDLESVKYEVGLPLAVMADGSHQPAHSLAHLVNRVRLGR